MRLGFYYHTPVSVDDEQLFTAGYLGCFLAELAAHVDELVLFMHETSTDDPAMDFRLTPSNIRFVSLGVKPKAVVRAFWGGSIIAPVTEELRSCDLMLVRAPTHLFVAWWRLCVRNGILMLPLVVGDYRAGNPNLPFLFPKKQLVQFLNWWIDWHERYCLRGKTVLLNSSALAEKYRPVASRVHEVRTTTLTASSFFMRLDTCGGEVINILYAGRYSWEKGLRELLRAFILLVREKGIDASLHFAGWEDTNGLSIEEEICRLATDQGVADRVIFHGRKKVGSELNALYRMADFYVIPSYAEGFPRTIWEAMANSCPVIATRVGAIPTYLQTGRHALLVPPKDVAALLEAMTEIIDNREQRQSLIREGFRLARNNTLEISCRELVSILFNETEKGQIEE